MPTSRSARQQQSRLAFTPLPSSSPAAKDYHQQIRDRAAAVTLDSSPSSSSKRRKLSTIPTPAASLDRPLKPSKEPVALDESDEDEPIQPTQRKSRSRQQRLDFSSARDADSFDSPVRLTSTRTRSSGTPKKGLFGSDGQQALVDLSSDSDAELPVLKKAPKPRKTVAKEVDEPVEEEDEDSDVITSTATRRRQKRILQESEDEDGMPTTMGKQKRRPRRRGSNSSFIVDSPPAAIDSEDDVIVVERPSKKRRRQASDSEEEEAGEDDEQAQKTPSRRRLKQRRVLSQQEKDDLAEDMGDLGASSDFEFNPVTSQSTQKSARQAALDRLKRKRTGQLPQVVEEDNEEGEDGPEDEDEEVFDDNDEEEEDEVQITSSRHIFKAEENDDDFVVDEEEEEGLLGVPDNGLPIEFTKYASMKPKELFKYAVEWMVQKKINPAFKSDDQLYGLTFKKLDDEVRGLAGSKFTSSAWKPEFILALQARPEIAFERLDRNSAEHFLRDKCDACNRTGHPATWEIQFRGQPYHRATLEDVADDDDEGEHEDSDSNSDAEEGHRADRPAWDAQDREIVAETHIFYVGKFCKSNAETAHSLHHWRHALYDWVVTYLTGRGYCHPDRLVEREKWNTKKRRKYANKIVDQMERDGEIKRLWRSFREQVDVARNSKEGRFAPDSP